MMNENSFCMIDDRRRAGMPACVVIGYTRGARFTNCQSKIGKSYIFSQLWMGSGGSQIRPHLNDQMKSMIEMMKNDPISIVKNICGHLTI